MIESSLLDQAAAWIRDAGGLLITAGAGMGVDSGLPDFRGPEGFWKAYPALRAHGLGFTDMANPAAFYSDPQLAWGFYGHRLNLYRSAVPHDGFRLLRQWAAATPNGEFVFTSNVDGQFQAAGFAPARVAQCHGSIHLLQCLNACTQSTWSAGGLRPEVNEQTGRLLNALPRCPSCGGIARPNILMFDDYDWVGHQHEAAVVRTREWMQRCHKLVTIELGAGTAISTVRRFSDASKGTLIRINPEPGQATRETTIYIQGTALEVLRQIDATLNL